AEQPRVAEHPLAKCAAALLGPLVLRAPDVFLDRHLRRAGHLAEFATGAEVEAGSDRGFLVRTVALGFRAEKLGTSEDVGRACHRAHRVAGRALGAGFDGRLFLDGVGERLGLFGDHAAIASWAARYPVAIARPPRDLVPTGS